MMNKTVFKAAQLSLVIVLTLASGLGQSKDSSQHRIIPLAPMSQDVEVLFGDPEKVGEPFVMRIRELPGGIIPPHKHPVDEHITVLQGTLYFGVGEKYDRAAMKELKAGSYAFIPKGTTFTEKGHYRNSELFRLAETLEIILPEMMTFLPPGTQQEIPTRLQRMIQQEVDPSLRDRLTRIAMALSKAKGA